MNPERSYFFEQLALGVFLLDRAERRGRREQHLDVVLADDPPERAGIGRAHRLSLVHDRSAAGQKRRVHDVGMAHDPAHVRSRPVHVAGLDAVDVLHAPAERHRVAAVVAHHALGLARRARGIEDVERVGCL